MNFCKNRFYLIVRKYFALVFLCLIVNTSVWGQDDSDSTIKLLAAENAMVGYNHTNHFKKKLLEFVAPVYNQPLVHSGLISSLAEPKQGASYEARAAADTIAALGADAMRIEHQSRLTERSIQLSMLNAQGMPAPGQKELIRAGNYSAKVSMLKAKMDFWDAEVKAFQSRNRKMEEMQIERLRNRMVLAKQKEIMPGVAKNAACQNFLLANMKTNLLMYGVTYEDKPNYREILEKLVLPQEDFDRILLVFDDQGKELIFPASKGTQDLGKPPFVMNHPEILPVLQKCEVCSKILPTRNKVAIFTKQPLSCRPLFIHSMMSATR